MRRAAHFHEDEALRLDERLVLARHLDLLVADGAAVATLALQSHWFYRWCKSYARRGAKDEAPTNPL